MFFLCFFLLSALGFAQEGAQSSSQGAAAFFHSSPTLATTNTPLIPVPAATPEDPSALALPTSTPSVPSNTLLIAPLEGSTNTTIIAPSSVSTAIPAPSPIPSSASFTSPNTPSSLLLPSSTISSSSIASPIMGSNTAVFAQTLEIAKKGSNIPASTKALMEAGTKVNSGVIATNATKMNLDECVKTALKKNPTILNSLERIRQQSGTYIAVRSAMIPQFGITNANYTWIDPNLNNKNGLPTEQVPINQTWGLQLQGSQLIYNGGTAWANAKAAKLSEELAYYELRVTIDAIIAQVITAFYQVVLNRALVVANQQSVELLSSQVEDQRSRYEAGTVPHFNVLQAEVQLANAQPPLITARNNLRLALFKLVQLIGIDYPNLNSVEVPFDVIGELIYRPRKVNTDISIYTALQRSPTLKAQRHNILVMAQNINSAIGGYLPTITANGGYQYVSFDSSATNSLGITTFNHDLSNFVSGWFFGIQGSWAIFDGLLTYGNVKQAKANLMTAKNNYDNGVRQVILSVQQAISNMQQAQETVDSQKANVLQAAEALRLSQERLNAGAGVQLDVLNAQLQLLQAQTTVLQSEYNYMTATALYDQALSLYTQYQDTFDDPMSHREHSRYKTLNSSERPQPLLPRALRKSDPLPKEFTVQKKGAFKVKNSKATEQLKAFSKQDFN